jgi:sulfonate transport system ATP-binding protein
LLAGLDVPDQGTITIGGDASARSHAAVRMIFQDARLLPWQTAVANVTLGLRPDRKGTPRDEREARARSLLSDVGLADRAGEWPGRLSGGQRQRVALARGLMSEPRVLLLDEPLGALDALTRLEMQQLIVRLWQARSFTAIFVTHDIHEAVALADRAVVLEDGAVVTDERIGVPRPRLPQERRVVETAALLLDRILGASSTPPAPPPELIPAPMPGAMPAGKPERARTYAGGP